MDNQIVTIDKRDILKYKTEGSNLVIKKNAEEQLLKLLDLKDFIDKTVDEVKEGIAKCGQKAIGEDFKGVIGKHIKAVYRVYGDKYETNNPEFLKQVSFSRVDSKKIDEHLSQHGELPPDTTEKERISKLIITRNEK